MIRRPLTSVSAHKCTLGDPRLDGLLRGGIPCGSLTELVGEASAGKTQTCMQLLMTAQWPAAEGGLDGDALYIYTEGGKPPMARMHEMAARRRPGGVDPQAGVLVETGVVTGRDLLATLERVEERLLREPLGRRPLRLIAIDSIANVFRDVGADGGGAAAFAERAGLLFRIAARLKRLADQYRLAVVTVNQVSDVMTGPDGAAIAPPVHTGGLRLMTSGREVQPALGLAWAHCVNHRVFLSREAHPFLAADPAESSHLQSQVLRSMQVVFSCSLPQSSCYYVVESGGLRSLSPEEVQQGIAVAKERAAAEQADWQ